MSSRQNSIFGRDNGNGDATGDIGIALYNPKGWPAIVGFICFIAVASGLWIRYFRTRPRTKWMLPVTLGTTFMGIGFIVRFSRRNGLNAWSFLFETILILATPCAFLAQEYTLLPRLSMYLTAEDCLSIRRTWIVKFFVTSDCLTFLAQLAGTALTVVGAFIDGYANIGRVVLLVALVVQAMCFLGFIGIFSIFVKRLKRRGTFGEDWKTLGSSWRHDWESIVKMMLIQCFLIVIRSVYRIVEYAAGSKSKIANQEGYFYVFDALPLLAVVALFLVIWPPDCLNGNVNDELQAYPMAKGQSMCTDGSV